MLSSASPLPRTTLSQTPFLALELELKEPARAEVEKLRFFDADYENPDFKLRGVTTRRWMSRRLGIEAGIGVTEVEKLRERAPAVGVGVVFSFD